MNPDQNLEPTTVSDFQLAMLAATINPEVCRGGNSRDALLGAMALWEESRALCTKLHPMTLMERLNWLEEIGALFERGGANRLYHVLSRAARRPPPPLILAIRHNDKDETLRPYLEKNLNLEGKKSGRPVWGAVRTVLDNFRWMFWDFANIHNQHNASRIQERNKRDEAGARAQGISLEELRSKGGASYHDEQWRDGEADYKGFLDRSGVLDKSGKVVQYKVEQDTADLLIDWKKKKRREGGVKKVRLLTPAEVFGKVPEKKIPKKVK